MTETGSVIGRKMPRPEAMRFAQGRGRYTDDLSAANVGHIAFLRSPHPHARIRGIETAAAKKSAGVVAILTGEDIAAVCKPWQTKLALLPAHSSPPQYPLACGEVCWQGEAVVAAVAATRRQAEDALELVEVGWEALPAVADAQAAAAGHIVFHSGKASNLGLDHTFSAGNPDQAFRDAAVVVEHDFEFGRQTGVTLESRVILAAFDPRVRQLTVHHSHQAPHQMRDVFAAQLGLPLSCVRVVAPDVGGAFGMKLTAYPDEMAVAAIAVLLGRTVKFVADRLESFVADIHAREARVRGRLAVGADGSLSAMEVSVVSGFGAYVNYPRGSVGEGLQAVHMSAAPYRLPNFRGAVRGYFQNKPPTGVLRGVGQPIACTVTEQLLDLAAAKLNMDPAEFRRRNYADASKAGVTSAGGILLGRLSLASCHERLMTLMDYAALRREQGNLRKHGVYRGIGLAVFVEQTAVGPALYGSQHVRVSANEACRVVLEPDGSVRCETSVTDQGQGTRTALVQIVADELGLDTDRIEIVSGDTAAGPMGGGAWASRGTALGGEAALKAARKLRAGILSIAGSLLQSDAKDLRIQRGSIVNAAGLSQMTVADIAAAAFYRSHLVPLDEMPPLDITESYTPRDIPYIAANGVQAAHVEVDVALGTIRVLGFWVVEDCGRVINPLLVDEQIRGGVVQGIGSALYEQCVYSGDGQLENGSLMDYLVPMASEMPDIHVAHIETPTPVTELGSKGVGEAGAIAASAAIWTAVNDALSPLGALVTSQPLTPEHVLDCIEQARKSLKAT